MFLWADNFLVNNFFSTLFCTIYLKEHIFKYKIKGLVVMVLSSHDQLSVILLKANKIFWRGLYFPIIWELGAVIIG